MKANIYMLPRAKKESKTREFVCGDQVISLTLRAGRPMDEFVAADLAVEYVKRFTGEEPELLPPLAGEEVIPGKSACAFVGQIMALQDGPPEDHYNEVELLLILASEVSDEVQAFASAAMDGFPEVKEKNPLAKTPGSPEDSPPSSTASTSGSDTQE